MKLLSLFLVLVFSATSFASSTTLLSLKRNNPSLHCEIYQNSVKIMRTRYGFKYNKIVTYQMDDLKPLIEKAFQNRSTSLVESEYSAYHMEDSKVTKFALDAKERSSLGLINLITTFCELNP